MKKTHTLWSASERKLFRKLSSPVKVQAYLDSLTYNAENTTRSVRGVIRTRHAHCFDGALLAAAAFEFWGRAPLIVDMRSNGLDDDHIIAVYQHNGRWGAVAKSNFVTCRFRDPVYKDIRELIMSYFDGYFNLAGRKTLREYSVPINLNSFKNVDWRFSEKDLSFLGPLIDKRKHFRLISKKMARSLRAADKLSFKGATLGINTKGAFKARGSLL